MKNKKKFSLPFFGFGINFNFKVEKGIEFLCSNTEFVIANEIIKKVVTYEGLKDDIGEHLEFIRNSIINSIFDADLKRPTRNTFDVNTHSELFYLVDYSDYQNEYERWKQAMNEKYSCDISITSKGENFNILVTVVRN